MKASIKLLQYVSALIISGAGFATMIVILHHALRWCMGYSGVLVLAVFRLGEMWFLPNPTTTASRSGGP
jgi:hypothetical protein